jgi:hypothetical protein
MDKMLTSQQFFSVTAAKADSTMLSPRRLTLTSYSGERAIARMLGNPSNLAGHRESVSMFITTFQKRLDYRRPRE